MGGPNNLNEVEVFLKNMFNDKNIITLKSKLLRKFIAFMIVKSRKKEACENYRQLGGSSPIVANTKKLIAKLAKKLPDFQVSYAMCYTPPFVKEALKKVSLCEELFVLPLYPHYSTTTIKSSMEDFYSHLRGDFKVKQIKEFYKNDLYNQLLVKLIRQTLNNDNSQDFDLIFSAHSLPQRVVDRGDVYQAQVIEHVDILTKILLKQGINFKNIHLAYQSKLGPVKWLEPELGTKLKQLKNKKVIISPISFTIDNSETDFELSIEYKEKARDLGFKDYRVCRCPNDDDDFVKTIISLLDVSVFGAE
ncbi:MAG: ferrochelatase [Proteobacteria bacterium]|nr:MAG: ferrochelatase [Pseudomonadota bacterium]